MKHFIVKYDKAKRLWCVDSYDGTTYRFYMYCPTKRDSWNNARRLARGAGAEAILLNVDGSVETRNSYFELEDD